MTARTIFLFTIILLLSLAFGGIVHASLPHDHSHSSAVSDLMHAAVRHNEQKLAVVPTILLIAVILPTLAFATPRRLSLMSLMIRSGSAEMRGLRSGILPHRRFG